MSSTSRGALLRRSLALDVALLHQQALSRRQRARLLVSKYRALPRLLRGRSAVVGIGSQHLRVRDVVSLGTWQSCIVDFAEEIVGPGLLPTNAPVVVDVGSNIGQFCAAVKLFFPCATVFCFEPDPDVYQQLVENTASIDNVVTFNVGLDREPARRAFYRHTWSVISSFAPFRDVDYSGAAELTLQTSTLDDMLPDPGRIDLVKIDVEGYELPVVEGGQRTLGNTHLLLVEVSLGESREPWPNLAVFRAILDIAPHARLVRCGRPLGPDDRPLSQDMVVELVPAPAADDPASVHGGNGPDPVTHR